MKEPIIARHQWVRHW